MNIHEIIQTFGLVILKSDLLAEIIKKKNQPGALPLEN